MAESGEKVWEICVRNPPNYNQNSFFDSHWNVLLLTSKKNCLTPKQYSSKYVFISTKATDALLRAQISARPGCLFYLGLCVTVLRLKVYSLGILP